MKFAAAVVLLILLVPAVSAVSILLPPEITTGSNLKLYYNESLPLQFKIRGDDVSRNVTFFIQSSSSAVAPNNMSTVLLLSNYSTQTVGVSLSGYAITTTPTTITYGVRYPTPGSGIGFENVNSASFNVDVICRTSPCNQTIVVPPVVNQVAHTTSSNGGGGSSGNSGYYPGSSYLPNGPSNTSNISNVTAPVVVPAKDSANSKNSKPAVQDVAADSGIAQASTPTLTNSNAPKAIAAAVVAGKSVAIALMALLVTLLVMEITLIKVVKTGGVEI